MAHARVASLVLTVAVAWPARAQEPAPAVTETPVAAPAPAVTAAQCQIAVLDLVPRGLPAADSNLPQFLAEMMTAEVASASGCRVIGQADVRSMVDFEATKQSCGEGDASCLAGIGAALGVQRIVAGSIGKLGDDYVLALRLVDIENSVVEQRAEEVVSSTPELRGAAKRAARALFSLPEAGFSISPLMIGGGVLALAGIGGGIYGVATSLGADARLGDPADIDKGSAYNDGRIGVTATSLGVLALGGGVALVVLSFME